MESMCSSPRYNITGYAYANGNFVFDLRIINEQVNQIFIDINKSKLMTNEELVAFNVSSEDVNGTQCSRDNNFLVLNGNKLYIH